MPLAMTPEQAKDFDEKGFIVLEEFFDQSELDRLLQAIDEVRRPDTCGEGAGAR